MSLVWLPFSASAEFSLVSSADNEHCSEMDSAMLGGDMSTVRVSVQSMNSAMLTQIEEPVNSVIDSSMQKTMKHQCCCDDNCSDCMSLSLCAHSSNHVSPFIVLNKTFSQSLFLSRFLIEQHVQYSNQIITPDFRPPIV